MTGIRPLEDVASELRGLINELVPRLEALDDQQIKVRPRPDKWARKEVLGHLIDSACNNHQKFVRVMAQPHLDFVGYKQDQWVDLQNWADAPWHDMIRLWAIYNHHLANLIANTPEKYRQHTINVEDTGPFTLEFIMADYLEHFKHHVRQIFPDMDLQNSFVNVYNA